MAEALTAAILQYISKTFTLAAPNLSINGLDVDPADFLDPTSSSFKSRGVGGDPEPAFEPFDARKRQRVEDLTREEEDLLREIAALKRQLPAPAAQRFAEQTRAGVKADEEALAAAVKDANARVGAGAAGLVPEGMDDAKRVEVEGAFAGAVEGLGRLKKEMPATVAKMERARLAGEYVVAGQ